MIDEFQVRVNADNIRAALKGMFLDGLVRGTLHLGYMGEVIAGKLTKRGRPRRRIVINREEAKIVQMIFEWFVNARLSLNKIAQKLNAMPDVPKPRNSSRWRHHSVRVVLMRATYRGFWKFSVTERKFISSKDYTRQVPREATLGEVTFESLRIVPDALWSAAQARLAKNKPIRGRKSNKENADPSLRILSGLFFCPEHDRPLRACSAFGKYLGCPTCATLTEEMRPLFSKPDRKVVLRRLCEKLAELIRQDADLIDKVIAECRAQAAAIQRPDGSEIERLEKTVAGLSRKIEFNIRNPGETEEDEKKIADTLRSLRRERQGLRDQLGMIKAAAATPVRVPTEEEVRSLLDNFSDILQRAAGGQLGDDQDTAREILKTLTGGRIDMCQQGEKKEMKGWLQGRFTVRLLDRVGANRSGPDRTSTCQTEEPRMARTENQPSSDSAPSEKLLTNSIGMKLAMIPAGKFQMGAADGEDESKSDEKPQHRVRITKPFYLGMYEVTQGEFERVIGRNPSWFSARGEHKESDSGQDTSRFPVEGICWYDAVDFCNKLSESENRPPYFRMTNVARNGDGSIKSLSENLRGSQCDDCKLKV